MNTAHAEIETQRTSKRTQERRNYKGRSRGNTQDIFHLRIGAGSLPSFMR